MATVRITNDIRYYVKNRFEALYRARIERKLKELQDLDIGNVCYEYYIPAKYRELAQQLNADSDGPWLDVIHNVPVEMTYRKNDANQTKTTVSFTVPLNPPAPLPHRLRGYYVKFKLLESMAPYEHAKKIYLELDAMYEERDKLIEQIVNGVLTKCSTLRQVLELWPTAMDFMPDEVKQKHAAKPEKRRSVVKELSIDNDVKVSLMKARMLTTGG
jgi:hypothetical protein